MDFTPGNNNNGGSGAECYDVGDISDIRINKSFLQTSLLFTKFSSSSVSFRYGIPFSYHNPKATGGGTGQIRFQFRLQFNFRLRFRIIIDSITTMVATIIPVCSSSSLQGDTSVVPTVDLNHSPSDVPRSILDPDTTNATKHPYLI